MYNFFTSFDYIWFFYIFQNIIENHFPKYFSYFFLVISGIKQELSYRDYMTHTKDSNLELGMVTIRFLSIFQQRIFD